MIEGILKVNRNQLNLLLTLKTGQNFRWKQLTTTTTTKNQEEWLGILNNLYVVNLIQNDHEIHYKLINTEFVLKQISLTKSSLEEQLRKCLFTYFRLDVDLDNLYQEWSKYDENFGQISYKYRGIRLLRQDVLENIFSFICSSNNNITRITKMVETLCNKYGTKLYSPRDDNQSTIKCDVYSFPSVSSLASDKTELELRRENFGYRAAFIVKAAKHILKECSNNVYNLDEWIKRLKQLTYDDAKNELMAIPGIGAKVADCICLMSLEHTNSAVPIDTHVYQLTKRLYSKEFNNFTSTQKLKSSFTKKQYNEIATFYRNKFKIHSGWAQTVLFCSDLLKKIK